MTKFLQKTILRVVSILGSLLLLKIAMDEIIVHDEIVIRILYATFIVLGIPLFFLIINVFANRIKYGNKDRRGKK